MRKILREKLEQYIKGTSFPREVYYSDVIPDTRYKGYKYFFKYHTTHTVAQAFKNQKELEEFIDEHMGVCE